MKLTVLMYISKLKSTVDDQSLTSDFTKEKKYDLSECNCGLVICTRWAG